MQNLSKLAAALLFSVLVSAPAVAADAAKGKAFATVNGRAISQSAADAIMAQQKAQGAPDSPEQRKALREQLISRELLTQEAKKLGVDKNNVVITQLELARQNIYINAFLQEYAKAHPISDAQLKNDYETIKAQLGGTEYKSRHILVEKEDDAKAIIENLDKGAKFDELAKQSKDPGSRENGGDLGWSSAGSYVKPFGEALAKLEKGKYTLAPVKTDFGYHVIMLEDSRPLTPPAFDTVKPQLAQRAQQAQIEKLVTDLRAKAKVE
jgi:peptidyl-prolyl cis-trans isomerase C